MYITNWIKDKIAAAFAPKYVGSVVRTLLSVVAGVLVGKGATANQLEQFVNFSEPVLTGLIIWAGTQGWSLKQKAENSK